MSSFPNLEPIHCSMPGSNCYFLTCIQISQEADQMVWYSHLLKNFPQFIVIYIVKGFGIVNKAEVDIFLELSCFFNYPMDVGNLISVPLPFLKIQLVHLEVLVHILLKLSLVSFECYFASMWDECNCVVIWAFFGNAFLWDWNENWPFQSWGHCWVFQIYCNIECSTFTASSFRIWNSSTDTCIPVADSFWYMAKPIQYCKVK